MRIFITGATGFIGTKLVERLLEENHEVICFVRDTKKARKKLGDKVDLISDFSWNEHLKKAISRCDAIINLAGEPIIKRWTEKNKILIYDSRIKTTQRIMKLVHRAKPQPKVVISSSAVGYYGDRGSTTLTERSLSSGGFLSNVCNEWERACCLIGPGKIPDTRLVMLRTGVVLGDGGALKKMLLPFKLGLGGILGNGSQYMPWIHIDDMVSIIVESLHNSDINGPVNCVSPVFTTNKKFTKTLGSVLRRPTVFPVPAFILKLIFGEAACVLLDSQKVYPQKLKDRNFVWKFSNLRTALKDLVRNGKR
jgi:uncharacterized protein (TIGR01777 family)